LNNGARALEGLIARWHEDTGARKASTGSANAYVFAAAQTLSAYYDGLVIGFDANFANTGSATINVDSLGAKTIKKHNDQNLASGDIEAGQKVLAVYDGTDFQIISQLANTSPITTQGDIVRGDATGADERLALGTGGQRVGNDGVDVIWVNPTDVDAKTATYTVVIGDNAKTLRADASGGAYTITLVAVATAGDGYQITIIKEDSSANAVTIDGNGSETINGATTIAILEQYSSVTLTSTGSEWLVTQDRRSPDQPAFLARNNATDANVTGNGTFATVDFDTEIYDNGADFAADTFTAPVTGKYLLTAQVRIDGITAAADTFRIRIVTSNRVYESNVQRTNGFGIVEVLKTTVVADMDISDTVTITVAGTGEASDAHDIFGTTTPQTFFSGGLLN